MKAPAFQLSGPRPFQAHRLLAAAGVALGLLAACAGSPSPCASFGGCSSGQECLANTCVPQGGQPVDPSSQRSALEPARWHVVSAESTDAQLPSVHFGGDGERESLLLDYDLPAIDPAELERAFLIVSPLPDAPQGSHATSVSAWRIVEDWTQPDPLHPPNATRPSAEGIASAPLPLRIDVTELVRRWLANRGSSYGVMLKSDASPGHAQVFATGVGGGRSPILELYHSSPQPATIGATP